MNFVESLLEELKEASESECAHDAFSFPQDVLPNSGQGVDPVSSTYTAGLMINIFRICDGDEKDQYIYSAHGDGGVLCGFGGPFASLDAAKEHFDFVEEGWTEF